MTHQPKSIRLGTGLLILLAWIAVSSGPASGSCVGSSIEVPGARHTPAKRITIVAGGATITLIGRNFFNGCDDTPSGSCSHTGPVDPLQDMQIGIAPARVGSEFWEADGATTALATVDADDDGGFTIEGATMPTEPGRYVLTMSNGVDEVVERAIWVK